MTEPRPLPHHLLLKYSLLVGLTPLIPLPLLDDVAQAYFERRMLERLAQTHQLALTDLQLDQLAAPPPGPSGWLMGCLLNLVLYPLKKLLRKIFFFLEIKRTIDLVAVTYAKGRVLHQLMARQLCAPAGPHPPERVRAATETAIRRVGTSPIELAVRQALLRSRELLKKLVARLWSALRGVSGQPRRSQVADAVRGVEEQEAPELTAVEAQVQQGIDAVPTAHFQKLESAALEALGEKDQPAPG